MCLNLSHPLVLGLQILIIILFQRILIRATARASSFTSAHNDPQVGHKHNKHTGGPHLNIVNILVKWWNQ